MSEEEFATTGRPYSDFPAEWGAPQGTPYSEQRLQWIEGNLVKGEVRMAKGETLRWMKPHTPEQILRYLEARRTGDEPEHSVAAGIAARERLLEFLKKAPQ
jgi:hypothetical protein